MVISSKPTLTERLMQLDQRITEALRTGHVALAFSGQAEDTLLLWRAPKSGLPFTAFMLDTGRLHAETLAYCDQISLDLSVPLVRLAPEAAQINELERVIGHDGIYESIDRRKHCCYVRKVAPLHSFLKSFDGWITGQRREQSVTRNSIELIEEDFTLGLKKFNPLADFDSSDMAALLAASDAPCLNPLHARGYPSIGCEPCTRAVRPGEDSRAGRWWWEYRDSKECGLHQSAT